MQGISKSDDLLDGIGKGKESSEHSRSGGIESASYIDQSLRISHNPE